MSKNIKNHNIPDGYRLVRVGTKVKNSDVSKEFLYIYNVPAPLGIEYKNIGHWTACDDWGKFDANNKHGLTPEKCIVITNRPVRKIAPKPKNLIKKSSLTIDELLVKLYQARAIIGGDKEVKFWLDPNTNINISPRINEYHVKSNIPKNHKFITFPLEK